MSPLRTIGCFLPAGRQGTVTASPTLYATPIPRDAGLLHSNRNIRAERQPPLRGSFFHSSGSATRATTRPPPVVVGHSSSDDIPPLASIVDVALQRASSSKPKLSRANCPNGRRSSPWPPGRYYRTFVASARRTTPHSQISNRIFRSPNKNNRPATGSEYRQDRLPTSQPAPRMTATGASAHTHRSQDHTAPVFAAFAITVRKTGRCIRAS